MFVPPHMRSVSPLSTWTDYTPPGPWTDGQQVTRNADGVGFTYSASLNALTINPNKSASIKDADGFTIENLPLPRSGSGFGGDVANRAYVDSSSGGGGIPDAPSDGTLYGRINATWAHALALAGGTMTGALILAADPTAALGASTKQYVDTAISGLPAPPPSFTPVTHHFLTGLVGNIWQHAQPAFADLSGSIAASQLIPPTTSALGGVKAINAVAHEFLTSIDGTGQPILAQPAFTDISGTASAAQLPTPTTTTLGGIKSIAQVAHQWISYIDNSGQPFLAQPAFGDISGTVASSQLPAPTLTTLGGVKAINAVSHQFVTSVDLTGAHILAQPAFTDISGTASAAQLPAPTTSTLGGVKSIAAVSHEWINSIDNTGQPTLTQPAFTDISGSLQASQMPAPIYIVSGKIGFGTETNPQGSFVFSLNATTGISLPAGINGPWIISADGANAGWNILSYGGGPQVDFYAAGGTAASPVAIAGASAQIGIFNFNGWNGSAWAVAGSYRMRSLGAFGAANPGYHEWRSTPLGGTSQGIVMSLGQGLTLGSAVSTTNDPGIGALQHQPKATASLPAASSALAGSFAVVNDSSVTSIGGTVTGGGSGMVLAACGNTKWTVAAVLT